MLSAIGCLGLLGFGIGFGLGVAAKRLAVDEDPLLGEIAALLPGSQCGQCGFPGCAGAAAALVAGSAAADVCPPGGAVLAEALSKRLGLAPTATGDESRLYRVRIEEIRCIGCSRCVKQCAVDAIVGAPKQVHGVVAAYCSGCGKCVEICPTEAAHWVCESVTLATWTWPAPGLSDGGVEHARA
mgnify:CR=1 FL=1